MSNDPRSRNFEQEARRAAQESRPPIVGHSRLLTTPETETTNRRGHVEVVLVKFFSKDGSVFPQGIPVVERQPEYVLEMAEQNKAIKRGQPLEDAVTGRYRRGRVDTGIQTIQEKEPISVSLSLGLKALGYRLDSITRWVQTREGMPGQLHVVCAAYARKATKKGMEENPFRQSFERCIDGLAEMTWGEVFVWDNPDQVTTVNCGKLQKGQTAKKRLVVENAIIVPVPL